MALSEFIHEVCFTISEKIESQILQIPKDLQIKCSRSEHIGYNPLKIKTVSFSLNFYDLVVGYRIHGRRTPFAPHNLRHYKEKNRDLYCQADGDEDDDEYVIGMEWYEEEDNGIPKIFDIPFSELLKMFRVIQKIGTTSKFFKYSGVIVSL